MYKIWRGKQLFHQTFWMQSEYSLDSLNFAAFTKPNKHKTDSKKFSTTWPIFFSNTFTTVEEFERLLQSFFWIAFRGMMAPFYWCQWRQPAHAQAPLHLPHLLFDTTNLYIPLSQFFLHVRSRPISARKWKAASRQGSEKPPSGRLGQVEFPFGQVTFSPSLPAGQVTGKDPGKPFADYIFGNDFEKKR